MKLSRHLVAVLFALWFAVAVLIAALLGCGKQHTLHVERRTVVRIVRCSALYPPPAAGSATADAYVDLERWVRLVLECP